MVTCFKLHMSTCDKNIQIMQMWSDKCGEACGNHINVGRHATVRSHANVIIHAKKRRLPSPY